MVNPYPFLKFGDLFVHPSYQESLCLSVLEAMAFGMPCVVVRSIGPESFIKDGFNGFLSDKGPRALFEVITNVLCMKREALIKLGANAIQTVDDKFSTKTITSQFENLIDGVQ